MADPRLNVIVQEGFAKIAHSIRRVGALYVAMHITPPDSSVEDLKRTAEDLSVWIRGSAQDRLSQAPGEPLGVSWQDRDA